jgi:hypothetical protein
MPRGGPPSQQTCSGRAAGLCWNGEIPRLVISFTAPEWRTRKPPRRPGVCAGRIVVRSKTDIAPRPAHTALPMPTAGLAVTPVFARSQHPRLPDPWAER